MFSIIASVKGDETPELKRKHLMNGIYNSLAFSSADLSSIIRASFNAISFFILALAYSLIHFDFLFPL